MSNLRQQIAASESLRSKFLRGKPFSEADVRMELAPDAGLRHEYDEAMKLVHSLTYACTRLREENDRLRLANWVNERIIQIGIDKEQPS